MDVRHTHELSNDNHFHDFIHNFLLPFVVFLYTNHCVTFSQLSSASLLWFLWEVRSVVRPPHIPGALSATSAVMRAMISRGPQTCSVHGQGSGALTHLPAQVCYNLCYSLCETQSNRIFCETTKLDIRWSSGQSMSYVAVIKAL